MLIIIILIVADTRHKALMLLLYYWRAERQRARDIELRAICLCHTCLYLCYARHCHYYYYITPQSNAPPYTLLLIRLFIDARYLSKEYMPRYMGDEARARRQVAARKRMPQRGIRRATRARAKIFLFFLFLFPSLLFLLLLYRH